MRLIVIVAAAPAVKGLSSGLLTCEPSSALPPDFAKKFALLNCETQAAAQRLCGLNIVATSLREL